MVKGCLASTIDLLRRQYKKHFEGGIPAHLERESATARLHNIDCEELMGMFSAAKAKAPNATLCYLSSKLRAQKNKTIAYIDSLEDAEKEMHIAKSIMLAKKSRLRKRVRQKEIHEEIAKRELEKEEKREVRDRRKLERSLKSIDVRDLQKEFPDLTDRKLTDLELLLGGKAVGRDIHHIWEDEKVQKKYRGRIEKVKKNFVCTVSYWDEEQQETYENAVDYHISLYQLAADLVIDDLFIC
eukprot:Seg2246.3 transcript_id=Seg2246.3/GoldUCD/mRNA.D3Y31 product="hypothetical protein" protein_id=Seg2246.3/GoldUCD/D3Y31